MPAGFWLWFLVMVAKALALAATFGHATLRGVLALRCYFFLVLCGDIAVYACDLYFGLTSATYRIAYYSTDLVIVVAGYFVLIHLVEGAFADSPLRLPWLRYAAAWVFASLSGSAALALLRLPHGLTTTHFCRALEQDLSFLGLVLTGLLVMTVNLLTAANVRLRRVLLAFGTLYSSGAIAYAVMALFPEHDGLRALVPFASLAGMGLLAAALWLPVPAAHPHAPPLPPSRWVWCALFWIPANLLWAPARAGRGVSFAIAATSVIGCGYALLGFAHARIRDADPLELLRLRQSGELPAAADAVRDFQIVRGRLAAIAPAVCLHRPMWVRAYYFALRLSHSGGPRRSLLDPAWTSCELARLCAFEAAHYRRAQEALLRYSRLAT